MPIIDSWQFCVTYLRARRGTDERGASLVEYALLVALIALVAVVGITAAGQNVNTIFGNIANKLSL